MNKIKFLQSHETDFTITDGGYLRINQPELGDDCTIDLSPDQLRTLCKLAPKLVSEMDEKWSQTFNF